MESLVEDHQWVVERITKHQEFRSGRNKVMKWGVKYKEHAGEQWEPARSFVDHLNDEWVKYNKRHKVNVSFGKVKALSFKAGIRHMSSPPASTGSHEMHPAVRLCYSLLAWDMGMSIADMPLYDGLAWYSIEVVGTRKENLPCMRAPITHLGPLEEFVALTRRVDVYLGPLPGPGH